MNIKGLIEKISAELNEITERSKYTGLKELTSEYMSIAKTMKNYAREMSHKSDGLDKRIGFFDRMQIKRDLSDVYKKIHESKGSNGAIIEQASQKLARIYAKYKMEEIADSHTPDEMKEAAERKENYERIFDKAMQQKIEDAVRKEKIRLAIENKKKQQQKRDFSSGEVARYESAMQRRLQEIREQFNDDSFPSRGKKDLSIRYELQNNTYYINGVPVLTHPKRLLSMKEKEQFIRAQLGKRCEFDFIVDKFMVEELRALKNCDPYIVGILAAKDVLLARDYMRKLAGKGEENTSQTKYNVIYDVRGLYTNMKKKMSFRERLATRKTANLAKRAGRVIEDSKRLPWYASIPFIGALAIGGTYGVTAAINSAGRNVNPNSNPGDHSYTDFVEPGTETTQSDIETTEPGTTYTETETTMTETTTTSPYTAFEDHDDGKDGGSSQDDGGSTSGNVDKTDKKEVIVNIGDKINVAEGLKYTADCLGGGNSNRIGAVSWRPATEYSIDRVAFVYQGQVLAIMNPGDVNVEQKLKDLASSKGIEMNEISTSVLLSLVPGIADTGWAQINLEDMKKNIVQVVTPDVQQEGANYSYDEYERE